MNLRFITGFIILSLLNTYSFAQQTVTFGLGTVKNVTVSSSSTSNSGLSTLQSSGYLPNYNSAARFLSQATLGTNLTEIQNVATLGKEQWLDAQLNLTNSFGANFAST